MKRVIKLILSCLFSAMLVLFCSCNKEGETINQIKYTDVVLCSNGQTEYKIVLPTIHTLVIDYISKDMANFLKQSTGAEFSIETDKNNYTSNSKIISLGETSALKNTNIKYDKNELDRDGYRIAYSGNNIFIVGGEDYGTAFGCYEFLAQEINFVPYSQDEIVFDKVDTLYLKDMDIQDIPTFGTRTCDGVFMYEVETGFRLRLLTDFYFMPSTMNGGTANEWIPSPDHTIRKTVSPSKYFSSHPEWFLNEKNQNYQCCYTNEEFIETYIKEIKILVDENLSAKYVAIHQEDNATWCSCSKCKEEIAKYGFSGYMIRFANKIINGFEYTDKDGNEVVVEGVKQYVKRTQPQRKLQFSTFAYSDTLNPPTKDNGELYDESCRPDEDLYIYVCVFPCFYHAIDDQTCPHNIQTNAYLTNWKKITNKFILWDYSANFGNYLYFFNDLGSTKHNLEIYRDMGVKRLYREFASSSNVSPFSHLKTYIFAKLSWDLSLDTSELIEDFMKNYYKETEPYMTAFLNLIQNTWAINDSKVGGYHLLNQVFPTVEEWPRSVIDSGNELLKSALKVVEQMKDKEEADKLYRRIIEEVVCWNCQKLVNYDSYGYDSNEYNEFVKEYKQLSEYLDITSFCEFTSMSDFLKRF